MTASQHHTVPGADPRSLDVEIGTGDVLVRLDPDHTEVTVTVSGRGADDVEVTGDDHAVTVSQRRRMGFISRDVDVVITAPPGCRAAVRTGSAPIVITGTVGGAALKSGSGDVRLDRLDGDGQVATGSGDITVAATAAPASLRSGSGDVRVGHVGAPLTVSTGSGAVHLERVEAAVVAKTGSGDLAVGSTAEPVRFTTASGNLGIEVVEASEVEAKTASGDVRVGVRAGTPVWTDVSTLAGSVRNELESLGAPADGQPHARVSATTISGGVHLRHV